MISYIEGVFNSFLLDNGQIITSKYLYDIDKPFTKDKHDTHFQTTADDYNYPQDLEKYDNIKGDHDDFTEELINTIFACFNDCKEIFIWGADYFAELLPNKNDGSWVVWDKRANNNDDIAEDKSSDKMYGSTFELCWSKNKHKRDIARVKWAGIFGMPSQDTKGRVHPTQKPIELCTWFLNKEDSKLIIDLFLGSGSTMVASHQLKRKCYGMELDPKYCQVIIDRMKKLDPTLIIKRNGIRQD
jgi:hypothetical protein